MAPHSCKGCLHYIIAKRRKMSQLESNPVSMEVEENGLQNGITENPCKFI